MARLNFHIDRDFPLIRLAVKTEREPKKADFAASTAQPAKVAEFDLDLVFSEPSRRPL